MVLWLVNALLLGVLLGLLLDWAMQLGVLDVTFRTALYGGAPGQPRMREIRVLISSAA